ncbi:hypothetical protein Tsubulata_831356 [Turnera subulata]|uniref:NADP-dependent oxidoreductase domain-containing protein n=1 Tax=Turnera subulata TaxID=218843 RepID=A0A9Q0JBV4_9ROSI|nr:hypothetical protein Tsubulata_831356 [Turnera subulata]
MEREKRIIPEVVLNSGHKLPLIGLGTSATPLPPPEILIPIFVDAIEVGYRHFDTASLYGSEEALGGAVKEAIERGLIKGREELFITSKLWCTENQPHLVLPSLKNTLQRLGLDYVDLYLVHWPVALRQGIVAFNLTKDDFLPFDMKGIWEVMEECSRLGLAKSIGVSNFSRKKLSQLLELATIPPAANQVELNVAWQQKKLVSFCKEKGIQVTAWSPLGANGAAWGTLAVMDSPVLKEIAASKGKSVAQIALRGVYEQGVCPIVKSFNKERMIQNLEIFEWELSQEEVHKIEQIPQSRGQPASIFVHEEGPYKSLEELWDEDED